MSVMTILSGKGGTGKTTVLVNLAYAAKERFGKVNLLDCDVEAPNVDLFIQAKPESKEQVDIKIPRIDSEKCTYCGICQDVCEFNAIVILKSKKKHMIFDELCHSCGACFEMCPEDAIFEIDKNIGEIRKGSRETLTIYSGFLKVGEMLGVPVIKKVKQHIDKDMFNLIDSSPGTSCPVVHSVLGSDFCLLVTEPTPFGLYDLQLTVDLLRVLKKEFSVVINKSGANDKIIEAYCKSEDIAIIGRIPFEKRIAELYSKGDIILKEESYKKIYNDILDNILNRIEQL